MPEYLRPISNLAFNYHVRTIYDFAILG